MSRLPEVNECYKIHKSNACVFPPNPEEHLRVKLFTPHTQFRFAKNLFPYILPEGYKHICLWINPKYSKFWTESRIYSTIYCYLSKKHLSLVEMFENEIEARSVLSIPHWHIICKPVRGTVEGVIVF
jgi:hypothetical protein